jgi:hypothetical protein
MHPQRHQHPLAKSERDIKQRTETNIIGIIHRKRDAFTLEIIHVQRGRFASALRRIHELELAGPRRDEIRRAVLVAKRVAADDNGFNPSWHGPRNALEDDRLAEDRAAEDVADLYGTRSGCAEATSVKKILQNTKYNKRWPRGEFDAGDLEMEEKRGKKERRGPGGWMDVLCHWENATSASA